MSLDRIDGKKYENMENTLYVPQDNSESGDNKGSMSIFAAGKKITKNLSLLASAIANSVVRNPNVVKNASKAKLKELIAIDPDFKDKLISAFSSQRTNIAASIMKNVPFHDLVRGQHMLAMLDSKMFSMDNIYIQGVLKGKIDDATAMEYFAARLGCTKEDLQDYSPAFIANMGLTEFKKVLTEKQELNDQGNDPIVQAIPVAQGKDQKSVAVVQKREQEIKLAKKETEKAQSADKVTRPFNKTSPLNGDFIEDFYELYPQVAENVLGPRFGMFTQYSGSNSSSGAALSSAGLAQDDRYKQKNFFLTT